jgi:hypothetical protein
LKFKHDPVRIYCAIGSSLWLSARSLQRKNIPSEGVCIIYPRVYLAISTCHTRGGPLNIQIYHKWRAIIHACERRRRRSLSTPGDTERESRAALRIAEMNYANADLVQLESLSLVRLLLPASASSRRVERDEKRGRKDMRRSRMVHC